MLIVEFGLEDLEVLLQPRISHKSPLPQTILLSYTCRSVESTGLEKHLWDSAVQDPISLLFGVNYCKCDIRAVFKL